MCPLLNIFCHLLRYIRTAAWHLAWLRSSVDCRGAAYIWWEICILAETEYVTLCLLCKQRTIHGLICRYAANRNNKSAASSRVYALYVRSCGREPCSLVGRTCSWIPRYHQPYHGPPGHHSRPWVHPARCVHTTSNVKDFRGETSSRVYPA